ncbi:MAG: hypothetical protein JXR94_10675 [Candidatus Hydrogenedentes bacterium]|nr:hypothetical protein [Candidatus Hydrogenedentota bacterium]
MSDYELNPPPSSANQPGPPPVPGFQPPVQPAPAKPSSAGRNCVVAGVIGCLTIMVVFIVVGVFAYVGIKRAVSGLVDAYTDTVPVTLPEVEIADEDLQALRARVDGFKAALGNGTATEPLVLTADDINALIQNHPDWEDLKGKAYVSIEGQQVRGEVSIPLEGLVAGRYLNGSATFDVFLRNGILYVQLMAAEVKGKALPEDFVSGLRSENLAEAVAQDPTMAPAIRRIESIAINNGAITITPKVEPAGASEVPIESVEITDDTTAITPEAEPAQAPE